MPYLLDTNHCFRLIARDARLHAVLADRPSAWLMTSVVVVGELRYGALITGDADFERMSALSALRLESWL